VVGYKLHREYGDTFIYDKINQQGEKQWTKRQKELMAGQPW
jgi:hypothetical protein